VQNFTAESQELLLERVNGLVDSFDELRKASSSCSVEVPVELLQTVDEGSNPDLFTAARFQECLSTNQATKGRVETMRKFHDALLQEAAKEFPELVEEYTKQREGAAGNADTVMRDT